MAGTQSDAKASAQAGPQRGEYDLFLSHAGPDKAWVLTLAKRLEGLGLRVFVDVLEIGPGDNWVIRLNNALERSRYLVLVLSSHTAGRPWVIQEWTSWMAGHGPLGRLLPVTIDAVELPFILKATQAIDATHRDAQQTADALFKVVGDPATLSPDDARRLVLGRDLVFTLSRDDEQLTVVTPSGESRHAPLPWLKDNRFGIAHLGFSRLHRDPVTEGAARTELFRHARTLGSLLFDVLFDETDAARLNKLIGPDRPRPVIQVRSDDALLLSLPWELLHHNDVFPVREGRIDLVRTTLTEVAGTTLLKEPKTLFKLVVNVSAPEGSHLSYEAESYRITLATADHCLTAKTELGTLADLVETVDREAPTGVHFSGHGKPGALLFESDEGLDHLVPVHEVLDALRRRLADDRPLPPFFYLATCHGNEPARLEQDEPGSSSAALQLHQAGVTEVVGYFGPIVDELSTRAEEALYEAIAEGLPTRDAVRRARDRLAQPCQASDGRHRPSRSAVAEAVVDPKVAADTHPFAWAQLVLYRRGPEWPLSPPISAGKRRRGTAVLRRTFEGFGNRRVLTAGFIGRRVEQHRIRRRLREGARVFVFQGLGGLGKSTLAQQVLPWLTDDIANVCTLWCQEVEGEASRANALVGQLLDYCRKRFGLDWEGVVQQVDRAAGDDPAKRFVYFQQVLVQNTPGLVLYLDNLESLLVGPKDETEAAAFGQWAEPALETIWRQAEEMAQGSEAFYLVASCRYRNDALSDALLPVTPLPPDALFRLTEWFPALRRLTTRSRAQLVDRLDGHPRAVEYADDLVAYALTKWRNTKGEWSLPEPPSPEDVDREWGELVAPALPKVAEKLKDNLLLQAIWDQVLDERAQRFLYRMTVLRHPADWSLLGVLGEEDEPEAAALATAERLRDTSLLEQVELFARVSAERIGTVTRYTLHPATVQFIGEAHPDAPTLRLGAHRRLGEHLETAARDSSDIETDIEAGHHLFEAGEFDRANAILSRASAWLQGRGRVREGLRVLSPFLDELGAGAFGSPPTRPAARYRRHRLRPLGRGREGHRVLRAAARHRARDWRPPGRGGRPRQPRPRLRRFGRGREGHRVSRAGARHHARDWQPAGRGQRPRQPWQSPTTAWARSRRPSGITSRRSSSCARLAAGGARAAPSAVSAVPTPPWARLRRPSGITSRRSSSRARLVTARARATPSAVSAMPTPPWARLRRPSGITSSSSSSRARSVTARARATPSAASASPTPAWARSRRPRPCCSRARPSGNRSAIRGLSSSPYKP